MALPGVKAMAATLGLVPLTACLFTGEIPQVRPSEEPVAPRIVNEQPPRYARVPIGPDGQLFEIWATDENSYDLEALDITWTLENLTGDLGTGAKLLLTQADLPAPTSGRTSLILYVQVEDSTGKVDLDGIYWELTAQPNLGAP